MNIVEHLRSAFQQRKIFSVLLVCVSAAASTLIVLNTIYGISIADQAVIFIGILSLLMFVFFASGSFSKPPADEIIRYLDRTYPFLEESAGLFVTRPESGLKRIQYQKIRKVAADRKDQIRLPNHMLIRSSVFSAVLLSVSLAINLTGISFETSHSSLNTYTEVTPRGQFEPGRMVKPEINSVEILITPPAYTGKEKRTIESGNVSAESMSSLRWTIATTGEADQAQLIFNDRSTLPMEKIGERFTARTRVSNRQIYRVMVSNRDTTIYSDYYGISVVEDNPPGFKFSNPVELRTLISDRNRELPVELDIIDDYGVSKASLNLTLASGSGESVRFRERTTDFDRISGIGTDTVSAQITLNADSLQMKPGDELYFYVTAEDNHPDANTGRSQTHLMVVEDTTQTQQLMAGSIVVDLLPEDFRSQRQIIIDTENLIEEKNSMSTDEFRSRSRRIGQDQAMLRLEFGNYMGMENESAGPSGTISESGGAETDDHDHDHGHGAALEQDTEHSHDEELDGEGQQHQLSTAASAVPEEFFHDHGSPEMNTLFAESPRALLQASLSEMFRAQQYLQIHEPELALPYEYRALELLQAAQQSERRYVRRAGYEGLPIPVDEKRLTGTFDDFANPGSEFSVERLAGPLVTAERMLREETDITEDQISRINSEIQQADISEGNKLYLMNRLNRLGEIENSADLRQQILARMTELNRQKRRDPSPPKRPSFGHSGGFR